MRIQPPFPFFARYSIQHVRSFFCSPTAHTVAQDGGAAARVATTAARATAAHADLASEIARRRRGAEARVTRSGSYARHDPD